MAVAVEEEEGKEAVNRDASDNVVKEEEEEKTVAGAARVCHTATSSHSRMDRYSCKLAITCSIIHDGARTVRRETTSRERERERVNSKFFALSFKSM